jgi:hypothetical protein
MLHSISIQSQVRVDQRRFPSYKDLATRKMAGGFCSPAIDFAPTQLKRLIGEGVSSSILSNFLLTIFNFVKLLLVGIGSHLNQPRLELSL